MGRCCAVRSVQRFFVEVEAGRDVLLEGDATPYAYTADNPLTTTDPTGHCLLFCWSTVGAALTVATRAVTGLGEPAAGAASLAAFWPVLWPALVVGGLTAVFVLSGSTSAGTRCGDVTNCYGSPPGPIGAYSMFGNWPRPQSGGSGSGSGAGGGGGGGGGDSSVIVVCGQACQQAQHVLANEFTRPVPPHETPAITQAQLNQRRDKTERTVTAKQSKQIMGQANSFQGRNAENRPAWAARVVEAAGGMGMVAPASRSRPSRIRQSTTLIQSPGSSGKVSTRPLKSVRARSRRRQPLDLTRECLPECLQVQVVLLRGPWITHWPYRQ